jgi:hypothetical protein
VCQQPKTDREVLVAASIFEMMLGPYETIGSEDPTIISGHNLESIEKGSALDTVEDIGDLGEHRSIALRGRIVRPTQDVGETMWSARSNTPCLVIERTQIVVMDWSWIGDVKIEHRHHERADTVDKRIVGIGYDRIDFFQLMHTRKTGRRRVLVKSRSRGKLGISLLTTRISQTIGRCVVTEAVSAQVAYVASPASKETECIVVRYGIDDK